MALLTRSAEKDAGAANGTQHKGRKYNMLVHNAKHIIIPLINQKLYECTQCKRLFNTVESLEWHSINSHSYISSNKDYLPKILQSFVKREPVTMLTKEPLIDISLHRANGESPDITSNVPELLESFVKKEPVTMLTKLPDPPSRTENILESFVKREPIMLLNNESFLNSNLHKDEAYSDSDRNMPSDSDDEGDENEVLNSDDEIIEIKSKIEFEYINIDTEKKIKDRLLFEDDDDDEVFHDPNLFVNEKEALNNCKRNTIILGNKPNVKCNGDESVHDEEFHSVHYDELIRPGVYRCKKCTMIFPSKFDAIIHETDHIRFKRRVPFMCRICDWAVGNNIAALQYHKRRKHPDKELKTHKEFTKCFECGLRYISNMRHRQNYHNEFACRFCRDVFTCQSDLDSHKLEHVKGDHEFNWSIKTVKVCDFCFGWFKDKVNLKYKHIKDYFRLGERLQCERCEKYCFQLKIVRIRWRKRRNPMREQLTYESKKKKPMNNSDRLKNVQQRLKMLKTLNKF
ncbi:uncharacterized protein LOC114353560 [Ostrinia furnacalis]|uniref:uncharacterized protein LOC114353560 n=1 Tax=Ostrinia furnacalis TaxID=93504 RepID=UPI00104005BC|nr:uncharacterized protein LOC114353560 [Ostrinia furnacalis]